jgi:hypothetical protein
MVKSTVLADPSYKSQTGFWERMLCAQCEKKLSQWESYAVKVLRGGVPLKLQDTQGVTTVSGIEYKKFKLFQMSILWRASASRLPFFEKISLGSREEDLRSMLIADDPGEPEEFGCWMVGLKLDDSPVPEAVIQPVSGRVGHLRKVNFIFGSFYWSFSVSREPDPAASIGFLRRDGSMYFFKKSLTDIPAVVEMLATIIRKDSFNRAKVRLLPRQ